MFLPKMCLCAVFANSISFYSCTPFFLRVVYMCNKKTPFLKFAKKFNYNCLPNSYQIMIFLINFYQTIQFSICKNIAIKGTRFVAMTYEFLFRTLFVDIFPQLSHYNYSSVAGIWHFIIQFFKVWRISIWSFADAGSSNTTRLPIPRHMKQGGEKEGKERN